MTMVSARLPIPIPGAPDGFAVPGPVAVVRAPGETTVVVLTGKMTGSGRAKSSVDLAAALARQGYRSVCLAHPAEPVPEGARTELAEAGAELQVVPRRKPDFGRTALAINAALRQLRPEVLIVYSADALPLLTLARARFGNPRLIFANRSYVVPVGVFARLVPPATRKLEAIACISASVASFWALAEPYLDPKRMWVVYNGVWAPRPEDLPSQAAARAALGLPVEGKLVGVIGRMVRGKGQEFLIRAWPEVTAAAPGARLLLAGTGPYQPRLKEIAAELGVAGDVDFLGWRDDIYTILPALDIFAHTPTLQTRHRPDPSRVPECPALGGEGFGRTIAEAMAAGLPVIATESGGVPEIVQDGETGLLVEAEDVAAIAAAVIRLLQDPVAARRMGQAGQARAAAEFSLDALGRRYHYLIQRLCGAAPVG